ncbi:MAG: hypothetical protein ACKOPI_03695 [bacterium]
MPESQKAQVAARADAIDFLVPGQRDDPPTGGDEPEAIAPGEERECGDSKAPAFDGQIQHAESAGTIHLEAASARDLRGEPRFELAPLLQAVGIEAVSSGPDFHLEAVGAPLM